MEQWFHVKSENNIADLGTRCNATATDLAEGSEWQDGKPWMSLPITQWPVTQDIGKAEVPEDDIVRAKLCGATQITELPICFEKYLGKSFQFILNLVARLLWILETKSFKDNEITVENMRKAEKYVLKNSMLKTEKLLEQGRLKSLQPVRCEDGVIVLQSRAVEGLKMHYGADQFPILAHDDPIAYLWIKKVHEEDHGGVTKTVAKSRRKFWIVRARKLAEKVKRSCYECRRYDKILAQQIMAPLPSSRLVMSPAFHEISLD